MAEKTPMLNGPPIITQANMSTSSQSNSDSTYFLSKIIIASMTKEYVNHIARKTDQNIPQLIKSNISSPPQLISRSVSFHTKATIVYIVNTCALILNIRYNTTL